MEMHPFRPTTEWHFSNTQDDKVRAPNSYKSTQTIKTGYSHKIRDQNWYKVTVYLNIRIQLQIHPGGFQRVIFRTETTSALNVTLSRMIREAFDQGLVCLYVAAPLNVTVM